MSVAAVAAAAGTGSWLALDAEHPVARWANVAAAAAALVLLGVGFAVRTPLAVPLAIAGLGAGYAAALALDDGPLDARAPVVAAALFLVAELAYWSLELRDAVADEAGAHLRRIGFLAALILGALAVGSGLLAVVDAGEGEFAGLELLGALAAVAALAIVALGARRPRED